MTSVLLDHLWELALGAAACVACVAFTPDPVKGARVAYEAAEAACFAYSKLPPEQHKPDADRACRAVLAVCDDTGAAAAGGSEP